MKSKKLIEVHAHRGSCKRSIENTLEAFEEAWRAGADYVELDIQLSSDFVPVIHHDYSTVTGLIRSLSLQELKTIELSRSGNIKSRIPTLEELVEKIQNAKDDESSSVKLNIELKRDLRKPDLTFSAEQIVDAVLKVLENKRFLDRVIFSSFDPEILLTLRKRCPSAILSVLFDYESLLFIKNTFHANSLEYLLSFAKQIGASILAADYQLIENKDDVLRIQSEGFKVVVWTVNEEKEWQRLQHLEIDGVITDRPYELKEYFQKSEMKIPFLFNSVNDLA